MFPISISPLLIPILAARRRLGGSGLNIILDLVGNLVQAVHIKDFLPNFFLISLDMLIGVDLLGEEIGHNLDRAFAVNVLLKDVGQ